MSEDSSFNRNQKKKEEGRLAPDFFGSLGKGILVKENLVILGNSSGLTPLSYSSNLTPLLPFGKNHKKEVLK